MNTASGQPEALPIWEEKPLVRQISNDLYRKYAGYRGIMTFDNLPVFLTLYIEML